MTLRDMTHGARKPSLPIQCDMMRYSPSPSSLDPADDHERTATSIRAPVLHVCAFSMTYAERGRFSGGARYKWVSGCESHTHAPNIIFVVLRYRMRSRIPERDSSNRGCMSFVLYITRRADSLINRAPVGLLFLFYIYRTSFYTAS